MGYMYPLYSIGMALFCWAFASWHKISASWWHRFRIPFFRHQKYFFVTSIFLSPKMFFFITKIFLSPKIFFCRQKIFLPTVSKTLRIKYYTIFYGAPMLTKMGNTVSLIFNWISVSIIAKNNFIKKH